MKFSFFTLILSIATGTLLFSQVQRAYYWPLQQGAALDFSGGQPQFVTDCALWSFEACGAICDEQGQLLMYTNGGGRDSPFQPKGTIWNKNHQVLYDMGNTEGGGYSAMQGATIIPAPGKPHHYYVLTMEEAEFDVNGGGIPGQPVGRGFSAFLVNMEANGGTGEVVQYWPMIFTPAYEAMCAIRHPNCEDYWVIINRYESGDFLVFPITSNGIGTPKYFNFSRPFEPVYGGGEIKASPDARWVISAQHIFKFDAINGTLSYHHKLNGDTFFGSFSPNSSGKCHEPGGFGVPLIPTHQHAQFSNRSLYGFKPHVAGGEVEFFVISGVVRDVHFAVFARDTSVFIKHHRSIVIKARRPFFKQRCD